MTLYRCRNWHCMPQVTQSTDHHTSFPAIFDRHYRRTRTHDIERRSRRANLNPPPLHHPPTVHLCSCQCCRSDKSNIALDYLLDSSHQTIFNPILYFIAGAWYSLAS